MAQAIRGSLADPQDFEPKTKANENHDGSQSYVFIWSRCLGLPSGDQDPRLKGKGSEERSQNAVNLDNVAQAIKAISKNNRATAGKDWLKSSNAKRNEFDLQGLANLHVPPSLTPLTSPTPNSNRDKCTAAPAIPLTASDRHTSKSATAVSEDVTPTPKSSSRLKR